MPVAVSHRISERVFRFLQQERTLLGVAVFSVVCLFAPHFLPLGVTIGALIFGAAFYPSLSVCRMVKKPFKAIVFRESRKYHSALSKLGV